MKVLEIKGVFLCPAATPTKTGPAHLSTENKSRVCCPSLLYIHEPAVDVGGNISHDNPGSAPVPL